jgi:6,7-dimethyl-8-ribityllumazine synthase
VSAPAKRAPEGGPGAAGLAVAVVASRFNGEYVERLLGSALGTLAELGLAPRRVAVYRCPGAFELPLLAREVARERRPDCIVALGAVIRGQTPHFDFVAGEAARGLLQVSLETGVPVGFGLITADTPEQAEARTRAPLDRGAEAARSAVEMARALAEVRGDGPSGA